MLCYSVSLSLGVTPVTATPHERRIAPEWSVPVNRTDVVNAVAEKAGLSKSDADAALKAFVEVVEDAARKREKVALTGFVTFDVTHRAERTARNPRTGEEIAVPATWAPKISAGAGLKTAAAESK